MLSKGELDNKARSSQSRYLAEPRSEHATSKISARNEQDSKAEEHVFHAVELTRAYNPRREKAANSGIATAAKQ